MHFCIESFQIAMSLKKITFTVFNVFLQLCVLELMRQLLSVEVIVQSNINSSDTMILSGGMERSVLGCRDIKHS